MPPSDQIHIIDTSALVNFEALYGDSSNAWKTITDEIESGRLKAVRQVWDELKRRFPSISKRLKLFRADFVISDAVLYSEEAVIELQQIQEHHGRLINELGTGNPADPFIIAAGKTLNAIVVTDEKVSGHGHKHRIPFVCKSRNVGCKSGSAYFKDLGF